MPIIDLQRRMRQLGEIRIGRVVDTGRVSQRTGKPILRPEKLNRFRLTSASKPLLEEVAALYGGTVQEWTPANGSPSEWEVFTEADRLPVLVPPREPVTQWYELFKGSKCVRRCDGQIEQKTDQACLCDPDRRDCQITTRLNVMLRDVTGLGVWLLTSHGYYAAAELPEVAQFLASTRGYVDAWLTMEEKQVVRDDGMARFMVPKLDVAVTPAQLLAGEGAVAPAAVDEGRRRAAVGSGEGGQAAIEGPRPAPAPAAVAPSAGEFIAAARAAADLEDLSTNLAAAQHAGFARHLTDQSDPVAVAFMTRRAQLTQPAPPAIPPAPEPAGRPAQQPAAPVETEEAELLWQRIVAAWPGTTSQLNDRFTRETGGVEPQNASEQELDDFLRRLRAGDFNQPAAAAPVADDEMPF